MLCEQRLLIPAMNKHSVDEVMVAYKGTRADTLRQYIANKPNRGALNYSARPVLLAWSMTCCSIRVCPLQCWAAADSGKVVTMLWKSINNHIFLLSSLTTSSPVSIWSRSCRQKWVSGASAPSDPTSPVELPWCGTTGHWPLHWDKRRRCNLCPKGVSRWQCQKYNVFLCLNGNQQK